MTDHAAAGYGHHWCVAPHEPMCDCPFAQIHPHVARGCRYNRDADDQADGDLRNHRLPKARKATDDRHRPRILTR